MARTYTKLFQSILDSTIWQEPLPTKVVWVTMLAMADKEGRVWAAVPGLAKRAGVEISECERALEKFKSPDPYSRSKDLEGRRIVEIDGGWELVNHAKYREMMSADERREYQRVKQAEYRARKKGVVHPTQAHRVANRLRGNGENGAADRLEAQEDVLNDEG